MSRKQFALIAAICGGATFLGVLLPWVSGGNVSFNGTQADFSGTFVLLLGLVAGGVALLVYLGKTNILPLDERQHLFAACGVFALALIVFLTDFFHEGFQYVSRGIGMWLVLLATVGGGVVCFLGARAPQTTSSGPSDSEPTE